MSGNRVSGTGPHSSGLAGAAWLLSLGLLVQVSSLGWAHPVAFMLFLGVGSLLVIGGLLRYLLTLAARKPSMAAMSLPRGRRETKTPP